MRKSLITICVFMILVGGIFSIEAKAERQWYEVRGGIIYVYDSFPDKYPWIDWEGWAGGSGYPFGGYIPGINYNPNPNDDDLLNNFANEAQSRNIEIDLNKVDIIRKGENSIVFTTTVNYAEIPEAERNSGVNVGYAMLTRDSDDGEDLSGFYSFIVNEDEGNANVNMARMPGLHARWGGNMPWWWEHRFVPNDGKIPVYDQDGMFLGSVFWWEIP